jgi:glycosyltransferase involved in cell wall biosynthesis
MEPMPLVSIIIVSYNYEQFLRDAIDSALNQTYKKIEVIVVDDGSTDSSPTIINSYGDQIIKVLKKNGGEASAVNAGVAASSGDIICLLDSDDLYLPERITKVVEFFNSSSEVGWVFTESAAVTIVDFQSSGAEAIFSDIRCKNVEKTFRKIDFRENIKRAELPNFTPSSSNLCFSRSLLEQLFPLPEIKGFTGMALTDLYVTSIAVGLATGYKTEQKLGIYRVHMKHKSLTLARRRRIYAEIYMTAGYWMKINFPAFKKLSKKLITKGYGAYLNSRHLKLDSADADCETMMSKYLMTLPFLEQIEARLMIFYYSIQLRSLYS